MTSPSLEIRNHPVPPLVWEIILIILSLIGIVAAVWYNEQFCIGILYYKIYANPIRYMVVAGVFLIFLGFIISAYSWCRLTPRQISRAVSPAAFLLLFIPLQYFELRLGLIPFYLTVMTIGLIAVRLLNCCFQQRPVSLSLKSSKIIMAIFFFLFVMWTAYYQDAMYHCLLLGFPDIGYYFNRLKNTVQHGEFLAYHSFFPTFYDHFCPGLALLLPVFWMAPTVDTLMVAQSLFIGLPGVLLFTIAIREKLTPLSAFLLTLGYFLYPAIVQLTYNFSCGFHPTSLALPFLVWSFYLLDTGRVKRAILPALIAVSMEEHVSIYFLGLGLSLLMQRKFRLGAALIGFNALYFLGIFLIFFPWHTGGQNVHVSFWGHLGSSIPEIAMSPFTKPEIFWGLLGGARNYHLLAMLTIPMLGLCLLSPRFIVATLPVFLFNFLRDDYPSKSIAFQYQVGVVGILYLGMVLGVARTTTLHTQFNERFRSCLIPLPNCLKSYCPEALLAGVVIACLYGSLYLSIYPWSKPNIGIIPPKEKLIMNANGFDAIQELVPRDATVTCDERTRAAVMDRRLALDSEMMLDIKTEYHVYQARIGNQDPQVTIDKVNKLLNTGEFDLIYRENEVYILRCNHPLPPLSPDIY